MDSHARFTGLSAGERIAILRKRRGVTQGELARAVGIFRPWLSRIENGRSQPGTDLLRRLARALDVPLEDLANPVGDSHAPGAAT